MASTASSVAIAMEVIAALGQLSISPTCPHTQLFRHADLFYNVRLNAAVSIFQIFASQMLGYGIAGTRELLLVDPCIGIRALTFCVIAQYGHCLYTLHSTPVFRSAMDTLTNSLAVPSTPRTSLLLHCCKVFTLAVS